MEAMISRMVAVAWYSSAGSSALQPVIATLRTAAAKQKRRMRLNLRINATIWTS
jgi:hypothetical protein